jgi:hypothetical protein
LTHFQNNDCGLDSSAQAESSFCKELNPRADAVSPHQLHPVWLEQIYKILDSPKAGGGVLADLLLPGITYGVAIGD